MLHVGLVWQQQQQQQQLTCIVASDYQRMSTSLV
jgi:hypothetical protein